MKQWEMAIPVLGILADRGRHTAWRMRDINGCAGWGPDEYAVLPGVLHRLERHGLVKIVQTLGAPKPRNGPYRLTALGRQLDAVATAVFLKGGMGVSRSLRATVRTLLTHRRQGDGWVNEATVLDAGRWGVLGRWSRRRQLERLVWADLIEYAAPGADPAARQVRLRLPRTIVA